MHTWDLAPTEAIRVQRALRSRLIMHDDIDEVETVAGVDVGFERDGAITKAAVAVLSFPALELVECRIARMPTCFPYVPGLLSFRELPAVLPAFEQLARVPELVFCDGQGYAHPRRFGIASHLGVLLDIPCIGVGKTRLTGRHGEVPAGRGAWTPLLDGTEQIGAVLRTRCGVKPLFVSIGHRVSLPTAIRYTMACTTRFRSPEPLRAAHRRASC